jgi:predicted metal-dependent phosphoesterase TrpH
VRIDLHTHSTASDGTHRPAEVVRLAAAAGLDVVALTDHDSMAGWAEASAAAVGSGTAVVPGIEISTTLEGAGVHLLGYLLDVTYPPLAAELELVLQGREGRLGAIIERLNRSGIDITEQDVRRQVGTAPAIGRPHVADVLVAKGVVVDRNEAFARWLSWGRPGHVQRYATPTTTMIRLVTEAGGAAVIAHPWGRGTRRLIDADALVEFRAAGLVGIEVDHQDHSPQHREALRAIAAELDLVTTGSSDFHGVGKVDHELGCNLTSPEQYERLLAAAAANAEAAGRVVAGVARP